jgi:uncharacterized damage-inducible protein DinB
MDCKKGTIRLTRQIAALLNTITPEAYAYPLEIFNGSTLGHHFRHIFDFYDCLLQGTIAKEVDYAARQRNVQLELDPAYAMARFDELRLRLDNLRDEEVLQVRADFSSHIQDARPLVASTIGRELMFAYDHAIHHLAMIKIGLRDAMPGLPLDEKLGVAPSTLKYRTVHH